MSKGTMQRVEILGRLGSDPDVRETKDGNPVVRLNIATNEAVKRKGSDKWEDITTWHHVTVFASQAEFCKNYLKQGNSVFVEAKLRPSKWQDKDGVERSSIDIVAYSVQQVGGRSGGSTDAAEEFFKDSDDPLKDVQ